MSTMQQILKNAQGGNIGLRDPMHRAIAGTERYEPVAQADGSYGALPFLGDPSMPVRVTDKFRAKEVIDPSAETLRSVGGGVRTYGSGMPPLPGSGGGGGGTRGSMGPQAPRRKIVRLGPRNTSEYVAENGGLSAPRESSLDAAYERGDFSAPPGLPPLPGASSGSMPEQTAPDGYLPLAKLDWDDQKGRVQKMAKGGALHLGKPTLVGEEGPELILPRDDGNSFVLPADITRQVLPAMRDVTPRKDGGPLPPLPTRRPPGDVMISEAGTYGVLNSPYGVGYSDNSSQPVSLPGLPGGISDEQGMVDTRALAGAESMPYIPDPLKGPWAAVNGAMPGMDRVPLRRGIEDAQRGVLQADIPMMPATDSELVQDGVTKEFVPLSVMKQRVADRAIDANNRLFDVRDRAERDRVQRDLAARAARAPLGSPLPPLPGKSGAPLPPLPGMRPGTERAIQRNMERFLQTPEGALYATEQARLAAAQEHERAAGNVVGTDMLPVGESGFVPVVRTAAGGARMAGGYIPNKQADEAISPERAAEMGLVPVQIKGNQVIYGPKPASEKGTPMLLTDDLGQPKSLITIPEGWEFDTKTKQLKPAAGSKKPTTPALAAKPPLKSQGAGLFSTN